jgi:hypothetical protein
VIGRPISFQMDLYQQLYVPRPVVVPELFASLRPPTYTGTMDKDRAGYQFSNGHFFGGRLPPEIALSAAHRPRASPASSSRSPAWPAVRPRRRGASWPI